MRELTLDARCPACQAGLVVRSGVEELPYFGETLLTSIVCTRCAFKHSTSMVLEQREPSRHVLRFRAPRDLGVRVVRSPSGTWRVPELGFAAEPAEASEAFVSNVEGVLERVRDVLVRAQLVFPEPERRARAEELLARLQRIREGHEEATLVLEDPHGTSAILSERARVEKLGPEEAALLRTGMLLLDADELKG